MTTCRFYEGIFRCNRKTDGGPYCPYHLQHMFQAADLGPFADETFVSADELPILEETS